jgi:hypothetical protein
MMTRRFLGQNPEFDLQHPASTSVSPCFVVMVRSTGVDLAPRFR